jgi:hypothetical protein
VTSSSQRVYGCAAWISGVITIIALAVVILALLGYIR